MSSAMSPDDLDLPPIPLTERYVVPEDGRRRLAWAAVRFTLFSSRAQRLFYAAVVVFALLVQTLEGWSPVGRALAEAAAFVVGGLALTVVWVCTVGFSQTYHSTRHRSPVGAVLESGFGAEAFAIRGPAGEVRLPYDGLRRMEVRGDFVFFDTDGIGGQAVFPRALFPDEQLARFAWS